MTQEAGRELRVLDQVRASHGLDAFPDVGVHLKGQTVGLFQQQGGSRGAEALLRDDEELRQDLRQWLVRAEDAARALHDRGVLVQLVASLRGAPVSLRGL